LPLHFNENINLKEFYYQRNNFPQEVMDILNTQEDLQEKIKQLDMLGFISKQSRFNSIKKMIFFIEFNI
jgi:predicted  nucleic acid-binding Zn ribbon protein